MLVVHVDGVRLCLRTAATEPIDAGTLVKIRNAYILIGKSDGMRPCGSSRHRWKNNVKITLRK
jgi:hypothetical protein